MDLIEIVSLLGVLVIASFSFVYTGLIGMLIITTLVVLGLSLIPATPIIPLWVSAVIIVLDAILLAVKITGAFNIQNTDKE